MKTKKILATIELENDEGRGELFYDDGDIYCRKENGDVVATNTGCPSEKEAKDVIQAAWGSYPWDLQWEN